MNTTNKVILILLGLVLCVLAYTCFKCFGYKYRCQELQDKLNRTSFHTLIPTDCMVLSKDTNAYLMCNFDFAYHTGTVYESFSRRDYLLYCYIFAIRDSNSSAASEFVSCYINDLRDSIAVVDTAMLKLVETLSKQILSDTIKDNPPKISAAHSLMSLYKGDIYAKFKDTFLYAQYDDTMTKYVKLHYGKFSQSTK